MSTMAYDNRLNPIQSINHNKFFIQLDFARIEFNKRFNSGMKTHTFLLLFFTISVNCKPDTSWYFHRNAIPWYIIQVTITTLQLNAFFSVLNAVICSTQSGSHLNPKIERKKS